MSQRAIARRAGCALATVSRALAGDPAVRDATRLRVLAAATALGYVPPADRLPSADPRRRTVAVLLGREAGDGPGSLCGELLAGIGEAAQARRLTVHIARPSSDQLCGDGLPASLARVPLRGAVLWGWNDALAVRAVARRIPCALIGNMLHLREPWISLNINQYAGVRLMLDHLLELGHRRVGFLRHTAAGDRGAERLGAFVAALTMCGLPLRPSELVTVDTERGWGRAVRASRAGVSAWIADSQRGGEGLVAALTAAGLAVPTQVSVASFRGSVSNAGPPLTSVFGPWRAIGRAAIHALAEPLPPSEPGRRLLLDVALDPGLTTTVSSASS